MMRQSSLAKNGNPKPSVVFREGLATRSLTPTHFLFFFFSALSHIGAFSRLCWSVESNLLACRIQVSLATRLHLL